MVEIDSTAEPGQSDTTPWWHPPLPERIDDLHGLLRLVLAGPLVWAGGVATFLLLLVSAELITGCGFMECDPSRKNVPLGALALLALGLVGAGSANLALWVLSPPWARWVGWKGVVGAGTAAAILLFVLNVVG